MKAYLPLDEMPDNCMNCDLHMHGFCIKTKMDILDYTEGRHPDCPLQPVRGEIAAGFEEIVNLFEKAVIAKFKEMEARESEVFRKHCSFKGA